MREEQEDSCLTRDEQTTVYRPPYFYVDCVVVGCSVHARLWEFQKRARCS